MLEICCLDSHFISFKAGLDPGSNNFAEFQALKLLSKCAKARNLTSLQVSGDSFLVINWMKGTSHLHNVNLRPMGDLLLEITCSFEHVSFTHVFRKLNKDTDKLSKEGKHLPEGHISYEEVTTGVSVISLSTL